MKACVLRGIVKQHTREAKAKIMRHATLVFFTPITAILSRLTLKRRGPAARQTLRSKLMHKTFFEKASELHEWRLLAVLIWRIPEAATMIQ